MKKLVLLFLIAILIFAVVFFARYYKKEPSVQVITHPLIHVFSPPPGGKITSPIYISGEAKGYWFFEASFPIEILDANGVILGSGPAHADRDWMTENFVPFSATLEFQKPSTKKGTILLKKDNPSGLPEHDDSFTLPINF